MSIIKKGTDFGPTEQVTSTKLDNLVDNASFTDTSANAVAYTGSTGTCLNGGGLEVTSAGQLQIKDADIGTAKLADDAVTQAKTSFIDANGVMTLSGGDPKLVLDDTSNETENNGFIQSFISGNMHIETTKAGSDVQLLPKDALIVKNDGTEVFRASSTSAKHQDGVAAAGAKVTGGLYATGDVYADDHVVADYLLLQGAAPSITFNDDDNTGTSPRISANSDFGNLLLFAEKSGADITVDAESEVFLKHNGTIGLTVSALAGKNATGSDAAGAKVSGHLEVTQDINCAGNHNNISIQGTAPTLTFKDSSPGATTNHPFIKSYDSGSLELVTENAESDIILDAKDDVVLQYNNNTVFRAGDGQGRNASNTFVAGCKVEGSLQVTDDINVGGTIRTPALQIGADNILDLMHPVGSVISTTTNYANSAAVVADYGGTTWVRFSEGRALTGYSTTDSTFSAGAEGGDKTKSKTIAINEIPAHAHGTPLQNSEMTSHFGTATGTFNNTKIIESASTLATSFLTTSEVFTGSGTEQTQQAMSLDVLQPYKVVYMWTRTA